MNKQNSPEKDPHLNTNARRLAVVATPVVLGASIVAAMSPVPTTPKEAITGHAPADYNPQTTTDPAFETVDVHISQGETISGEVAEQIKEGNLTSRNYDQAVEAIQAANGGSDVVHPGDDFEVTRGFDGAAETVDAEKVDPATDESGTEAVLASNQHEE